MAEGLAHLVENFVRQDDGSGSGGSAGVALVLLIALVGGGVWAFRRATGGDDEPAASIAVEDLPTRPPDALRIALWVLVGTSLLGLVLPVLSSEFGTDGKLSDAGGEIIVYFIVAWVALFVGAEFKRGTSTGLAIAQGAAISFGGYVILLATAFWSLVYLSEGIIDAGAGVIFLSLAGAACIWMVALRRLPGMTSRSLPLTGAHIALGVGGGLTTLGIMLPPNDSGRSFSDVNFDWDPFIMQIAWLVFLASLLAPAMLAIRDRTNVGLGLAAGALAPTGWLAVTTLIDSDDEFGFSTGPVTEAHPLFLIGAIVQLVALIVAYRSIGSEPAIATGTADSERTVAVDDPATSAEALPSPSPQAAQQSAGEGGLPAPDPAMSTEPSGAAEPRMSPQHIDYDTETWTTDEFRAVSDLLTERGVAFEVDNGLLRVAPDSKLVVDRLISEVRPGPAG